MIRFSAEAILASSTSKFGIRIPLTEHEDFRSPSDSTVSTSLIHCRASVGNFEQVHASILNLIFPQATVVGVGTLSKWISEICNRCWSAPKFKIIWESSLLRSNKFPANGPVFHLEFKTVSGIWRSSVNCGDMCSVTLRIQGSKSPGQSDEEDARWVGKNILQ